MSKARDLANAGTALTTVSATELGYLDGVTSAVQTQINSKEATLPSQTGNSGKYLTTDGTNKSWGTVSQYALPSQTGNAGKFLTTNGTTESWGAITTDRTNSNWFRIYDAFTQLNCDTRNSSIAKDSSGNIYTVGKLAYQNNTGHNMLLINKYNVLGEELSSVILYNSSWQIYESSQIVIDSSNNIYICGTLYDSNTFNGFIIKLSSSLTITWAKHISSDTGQNTEAIYSIAVDTSGNVYYTGTLFSSKSLSLIGKLDSSGAAVWTRKITETSVNGSLSYGIALDSSNNVYACGRAYRGTTNGYDAVLVKYDSAGTLQWKTAALSTGTATDFFYKVVVDSSGNSYAVGYAGSPQVAVLAKFDTSGTLLWSKSLSAAGNGLWADICIDSTSLYVVGQVGTSYSTSTTAPNLGIAKYNTDGTLQWQRIIRNGADGAYVSGCLVIGSYLYCSAQLYFVSTAKSAAAFRIKTDGTSSILDTSAFSVDSTKLSYETTTYTEASNVFTTVAWSSGTDASVAPTNTSWTPVKQIALGHTEIGYFN
jgi:hypothetical protein